jgi:hypothetical protein
VAGINGAVASLKCLFDLISASFTQETGPLGAMVSPKGLVQALKTRNLSINKNTFHVPAI